MPTSNKQVLFILFRICTSCLLRIAHYACCAVQVPYEIPSIAVAMD